MDDQKGNKNRLKAIIPFFVKEWSMRLLDGQDMEPDLKSCSCPLLVNTADPLRDKGQCALRKQACHFLDNDSSDTSGVKKKKKKHLSFCYRTHSRLSRARYLRGHNVNLRITSRQCEVHAVDCEQKWICVRTGPEKYHMCWLANIIPPESDLKKISPWLRIFGPWPLCWERDHVCYRVYINNVKSFHWKNTKGEKKSILCATQWSLNCLVWTCDGGQKFNKWLSQERNSCPQ